MTVISLSLFFHIFQTLKIWFVSEISFSQFKNKKLFCWWLELGDAIGLNAHWRQSRAHSSHNTFSARRLPKVNQSGQTRLSCVTNNPQHSNWKQQPCFFCLFLLFFLPVPSESSWALLHIISTQGCRLTEAPRTTWKVARHFGRAKRTSKLYAGF